MAETYNGGFLYNADLSLRLQRALKIVLLGPLRCILSKFTECSWRNEELLKPKPLRLDSRIQVNIPVLLNSSSNPVE